MNFGGISSYERNNVYTGESISKSGPRDNVHNAKAANAAALGNVKEGQVVTGEVESINGKTMTLKLPDDQRVTARLEADVKVQVGESLAFSVKSNSGREIALTPMFNQNAVNATAVKALTQAAIMVNESSLAMASSMMENNMAIDKNSLQAMFRNINRFPEAEPADIVDMTRQGFELNEDNIKQFSAYRNNAHQIIEIAGELSDEIVNESQELNTEGRLMLADIFNEASKEVLDELKEGLDSEVTALEMQLKEQAMKAMEKPAGILDVARHISDTEDTQAAEPGEKEVIISTGDTELTRLLDQDVRNEMADSLRQLGAGEDSVRSLLDGTMSPQKALSYIQNAGKLLQEGSLDKLNLEAADIESKKEAARMLLEGEPYKALLKNAAMKNMSLSSEEGINKEKVSQLYDKLNETIDKTAQLLEHLDKGDSKLAEGLNNLKQNISFMNQLNETFTYVQLPIQMSGENAHGDLYVYTNKKKLMEKDGEVTALLHLEMDSLGTMDIHVALRDSNKVKTNFVLQDEETLDFVESNIHILNERLMSRGYDMEFTSGIKDDNDKSKNPAIEAMLGSQDKASERLISRYSFDVKA